MRTSYQRTLIGLAVLICALTAGAAGASADSPHFIRAAASVGGSGNLVCTFKEVGLGNTAETEAVTCSADATAVYACLNGGGNHPKAANKATVNGPVSGGGIFPVRNGSTNGSISVAPPSAGAFSCPNGQRLVLASVCYADVTLTGAAGDTATATPNPACRTFFDV
jgi:hypothetical protein